MTAKEPTIASQHESPTGRESGSSARTRVGAVMMAGAALFPSVGHKHSAEATTNTEAAVEHQIDYRTETEVVTPAVPAHTETHTVAADGQLEYQEDFKTDAEDTSAVEMQIAETIAQNAGFFEGIEHASEIRVYGMASAENSGAPMAGLQTESVDNAGLAMQRAAEANTALAKQVAELSGVDISDKVTVEIDQNLLTDDELKLVIAVSGAESDADDAAVEAAVEAMIARYNDDRSSVSPEQQKVLNVLLDQRRGWRVEADHVVTIPGKEAVTITRCVAVSGAGVKVTEYRSDEPGVERVIHSTYTEAYIPEQPAVPTQPPRRASIQRELPNWQDSKARGQVRPKERYVGPNVRNGNWH